MDYHYRQALAQEYWHYFHIDGKTGDQIATRKSEKTGKCFKHRQDSLLFPTFFRLNEYYTAAAVVDDTSFSTD